MAGEAGSGEALGSVSDVGGAPGWVERRGVRRAAGGGRQTSGGLVGRWGETIITRRPRLATLHSLALMQALSLHKGHGRSSYAYCLSHVFSVGHLARQRGVLVARVPGEKESNMLVSIAGWLVQFDLQKQAFLPSSSGSSTRFRCNSVCRGAGVDGVAHPCRLVAASEQTAVGKPLPAS